MSDVPCGRPANYVAPLGHSFNSQLKCYTCRVDYYEHQTDKDKCTNPKTRKHRKGHISEQKKIAIVEEWIVSNAKANDIATKYKVEETILVVWKEMYGDLIKP